MIDRTQRTVIAGLAGLGLCLVSGCSTHQRADEEPADVVAELEPVEVQVDVVIDAVRSTLMDYRFAIDRVDARRGVVTTHPKRTVGLASPWDREQSSMDQEWEDLLNEQRRVVRVEIDRRDGQQLVDAVRVSVEVLRTSRPGWRVQTESVRLSTHARSRGRDGELLDASSFEVVGLDSKLAQRLADAIDARLSLAAAER